MPVVKVTHDVFVKKVRAKRGPDFEIINEYKGSRQKVKIRHVCGEVFEAIAANFLNMGVKCPCQRKQPNPMMTHDEFVTRLREDKNDMYEAIGEYHGTHEKIDIRCKQCDYIWSVKPNSLFYSGGGQECPKCALGDKSKVRKKRTTEEFREKVKELTGDEYKVIGNYINDKTKILMVHVSDVCDNHQFEMRPDSFIHLKNRCPRCKFIVNESAGERAVKEWLEENQVEFVGQHRFDDCRLGLPLIFDFWIPSMKTAIEFDGEQHFRAFDWYGGEEGLRARQLRDRTKDKYCSKNGIRMIRISYKDKRLIPKILEQKILEEGSTTIPNGSTPQVRGKRRTLRKK